MILFGILLGLTFYGLFIWSLGSENKWLKRFPALWFGFSVVPTTVRFVEQWWWG